MIWHLVKKDLRKTWAMDAAFIGFTVLLCVAVLTRYSTSGSGFGTTSGLMMAGLMLFMLVFGNTMNIEKYEEKNSAYKVLSQLPVSRFDLVVAKFVLILSHTIAGVVVLHVIYSLFSIIADYPGSRMKYLIICGAVNIVANAICYLGIFKWSYRRMRSLVMAMYIVCLVTPQLVVFLMTISGNEPYIVLDLQKVGWGWIAGMAVLATALFAAFAFMAVRMPERPEE